MCYLIRPPGELPGGRKCNLRIIAVPINEEELRRAVLESRFDRWIAFLRNLEQTAETDRTVVRFPNSSKEARIVPLVKCLWE